ncbi:hypothetical protein E4U42_001095 [Claviceps africana]|uniref:DNA damage-responsive protein 48 n=1 Tax=Claviceps africana TaxID=83212 RepID=A0A8K0JCD5_9HYPO|nr:hypothetical protein E4U42_001095 [Claviceps africana]
MDFLKKVTDTNPAKDQKQESQDGVFSKLSSMTGGAKKDEANDDGVFSKLNSMAGGGKQGEANEDGLDKAVDFVQEKFMGQGDQSNESAAEQAKDEAISDFIRDKYKTTTGKDFFIPDKDKKLGL